MRRVAIPGTDLSLCPIGLGTVKAGLTWDGEDADRIFDAYLEFGGNLVDTAHVYNDWVKPERARSERVVGDWLARSGKRRHIVLATKGGHPDVAVEKPDLHKSRMTRADMEEDLDGSLKRLRTDHIDIYFYHRDDPCQPVEALIEGMEDFVRAGKIRWYGCSNWSTERMRAADAHCKRRGYRGFVANQALLNLGLRHMNPMLDDTMVAFDEGMRAYHREATGNLAMPYSGVCGGFFHRYLAGDTVALETSPYLTEGNRKMAERVKVLTESYSASGTQVLLGFFAVQEFACVPLYGPQSAEQVADMMGALAISFRREDYSL